MNTIDYDQEQYEDSDDDLEPEVIYEDDSLGDEEGDDNLAGVENYE